MAASGVLIFPAINDAEFVKRSKFDNGHGCRHSFPDGVVRATDVNGGKRAQGCGYGDDGQGSILVMRGASARVDDA